MENFEDLLDTVLHDPVVGRIVILFFGVAIIWGFVKFLRRNVATKIKNTEARYRVRKIMVFIGYVLVAVLIFTVYNDKLKGLSVALGVAGAGIAFALQEVITSIAGWLAIVFGSFYKTGDRVELGGIKGDVIDIGVLRTTIMEMGEWVDGDLYNGRIVLVANSFIFKAPVYNYSGDFAFLWDEIHVPVQFGSNVERMRTLMYNIAVEVTGQYQENANSEWTSMLRKYMIEHARTEPMVTVEILEGGLEFTLRYTVNYRQRRITKDKINTRILEEIYKTDKDILLPQPTLEVVSMPDINMKQK